MPSPNSKLILSALVALCLGWTIFEARNMKMENSGTNPCATAFIPPPIIEAAFSDILKARDEGRREEALLGLQKRAEKGPHNGFAHFLMGELTYEDGAYSPALQHYRKAVETSPSVTDRISAFNSAKVLAKRLEDLRTGPWAGKSSSELKDLFYLQRRLAGGCE